MADAVEVPAVKIVGDEPLRLVPIHPDQKVGHELLKRALGIKSEPFYRAYLESLIHLTPANAPECHEWMVNHILGVVTNPRPRDSVELQLLTKFAMSQLLAARFARDLFERSNPFIRTLAERGLNKAMRVSPLLAAEFKRYRNRGQQTVTVQYLNMGDGSQAIVGNVTTPAAPKKATSPPPAPTTPKEAASSPPAPAEAGPVRAVADGASPRARAKRKRKRGRK